VAVNLSHLQFGHRDLVGLVSDAVREHEINPRHLTLELTETICIHDIGFATELLGKLKGVGVSISVDDFGTGYSSLSYVKKLPVDNLKIDMSFVRDVTRDPDAASIITAITSMARGLGLRTIAEGIETEEQRKILHLLRCDMGQGYHFGRAVRAEAFETMFARVPPPPTDAVAS
jgi:EAL domain-containing protein (putative c-di-GMP-specific phosphodiesterase class I)